MISFQKIYGLYGLKHHTVEINGNVTLEDIHTDRHAYIHVNIELEFCEVLTEFAINQSFDYTVQKLNWEKNSTNVVDMLTAFCISVQCHYHFFLF